MAVSSDQVAQRLTQIQQNGYGSIPLQAQASLANSGTTNEDFNQTAGTYHAADMVANGKASYWFDDPVLQKDDSPALQIKRYVSSAVGAWPIQEAHVQNVQLQMQKAGYGKDIVANGVWSPDWYAALNQAKSEARAKSLGGDTGGFWSDPVGSAMHFLGHALPEDVINAAAGIVKALPQQLRGFGEDMIDTSINNGVPGLNIPVGSIVRGTTGLDLGAQGAALGGRVWGDKQIQSASDYEKATHGWNAVERGVNDVNTALLLTSGVGAARGIAAAAGEHLGLGGAASVATTEGEAAEGGGLAARTFNARPPGKLATMLKFGLETDETGTPVATAVRRAAQRTIAGTAIGGVTGGTVSALTGHNVTEGALYGAVAGGALAGFGGSQAVRNMPVLGRIAPVMDNLTDADGAWYSLRNSPKINYYLRDDMAGAATRAIGTGFGKAGEFGLKVGALGDISNQIEGNTGYGAIGSEHTGEDWSKKFVDFQHNVLHSPIAANLNDLAFLFHTPEGNETLSQSISKQASSAVAPSAETLSDMYGDVLHERFKTSPTKVIEQYGGAEHGPQIISNQMDHITASLVAQEQATSQGLEFGTPAYTTFTQDAEARALSDRDALHAKAEQLLSQPGGKTTYATEWERSDRNAAVAQARAGGSTGTMANFAEASTHFKNEVLPRILGPTEEAQAAGSEADSHKEIMDQATQFLKDQSTRARADGNTAEVAHYQYLGNTLTQAAEHDKELATQLRKAVAGGNQDLIADLQKQRDAAGDTLNQAIQDAHAARPGTITPTSAAVGEQATSDYLAHRDLWNKSLDHQNASNLLVNPSLADRAGRLGLAGVDVATGESVEREIKYIENQYQTAVAKEAAANQARTRQLTGADVPGFDEEHTPVDTNEAGKQAFEEKTQAKKNLLDLLWHHFGQQSKDGLDLGKIPYGPETGVDKRFSDLIDYAREQSKLLAREVHLTPDAPADLVAAEAKLKDMGYQIVSGTDIGHDYIPHNIIDATGGQQSRIKDIANSLGLKWEPTAQMTINTKFKNDLLAELGKTLPKLSDQLPGMDEKSYGQYIREIAQREETSPVKGAVRNFTTNASDAVSKFFGSEDPGGRIAERQARIRYVAGEHPEMSGQEVEQLVAKQIQQDADQVHGIRNINRKQFIQRAMSPDLLRELAPDVADLVAGAHGDQLTRGLVANENDANQLYNTITRTYAKLPTSMMGLEHIENFFRSSFGFAGSGDFNIGAHDFHIPGGSTGARFVAGTALGAAGGIVASNKSSAKDYLDSAIVGGGIGGISALGIGGAVGKVNADRFGWAMSNLPNKLIQARNDWRFALSPMFSLRRSIKTALKVQLNGDVQATLRPATAIKNMEGGYDAAFDTLNRVRPQLQNFRGWGDEADAATQMLEDNDIWTIYNARNNMAYMARAMELNGKGDNEIGNALDKTFNYTSGYGDNQIIGRSALERSTNMVFFPFSFDKRLYGGLGAYMLDRPAQQITMTAALTAFNEFQKGLDQGNPLAVKFWENHAPILQTMEQLNPLAHGVSIGEAGGVNRPLMNAFMPQAWVPTSANNDLLSRYIPAIKDAHQILGQMAETGQIFGAASEGLYHKVGAMAGITDKYTNFGNPGPSTLSTYAQVSDAYKMQTDFYNQYSKILDYNQGRDKTDQIVFPRTNDYGKFGGLPITKQTIRDIISKRYPAYDPTKAIAIATTNQEDLRQYEEDNNGTPLGQYATTLIDTMQKVGTALGNNKVPAKMAAQLTDQVRASAIYLAQKDPKFYKLYQKNFDKMYGPLERFGNP